MATEYPSRLLLNAGADLLVLNGGADTLMLGGNTDFEIDDLAGAGAQASAPSFVIDPGPVDFSAIGAGASAEAPFAGIGLVFGSAGATSSGATPVFEPGPINFQASLAAGANAGVLAAGNAWGVEYPAGQATAGAPDAVFELGLIFFSPSPASAQASTGNMSIEVAYPSPGASASASDFSPEIVFPSAGATASGVDIVFEPGPADFSVTLAAGANAGALSFGNHWEIEYPSVGASAGVGGPSYELSIADAAGASAASSSYSIELVADAAGASAVGNDCEFLPGEVFFPLSGVLLAAGANAGVLGPGNHWEVEYPAVGATASGADPVIEPGPVSFPLVGTLDGSPATAGAADYENEIAVEYAAGAAATGAGLVVYEPGPVDFLLGAAGASAGTDAEGYDLDVFFPAVGATAGASAPDLEIGLPEGAAATAGIGWETNLWVLPLDAPIVAGVRSNDYASATITWTAVRGATGYKVYRGDNYRDELALVGTVSAPTTHFADSGLTPPKPYTYAVRAIDGDNVVDGLRSLAVYLPAENETITA